MSFSWTDHDNYFKSLSYIFCPYSEIVTSEHDFANDSYADKNEQNDLTKLIFYLIQLSLKIQASKFKYIPAG